ncbi:MAG TPA: DUF4902 domain-containing protein [Steroidobacteraceae bacterium]|jgi:hypothetical protein
MMSGALRLSDDGYVRLTLAALRTIKLTHLISELDPDTRPSPCRASGASAASIVGFTEWVSHTTPALSLGWDWRIATIAGQVRYEREGEVRSNAMLINVRGRDLGETASGVLLCIAVDRLEWKQVVDDYISNRYARHLSTLTVTESRTSL